MRNPGNEYRTIPSARADLFKLRDGWRVLAGVFHQLVAAGLPGGREVGRVWHGGVWSSGPCRRLAASGDRRLPRGKGSTTSARRSTPSTCAILKCRIDGTRGRTGAAYAIGYSQERIALRQDSHCRSAIGGAAADSRGIPFRQCWRAASRRTIVKMARRGGLAAGHDFPGDRPYLKDEGAEPPRAVRMRLSFVQESLEYHPFRRVWKRSPSRLDVGFNYFDRTSPLRSWAGRLVPRAW